MNKKNRSIERASPKELQQLLVKQRKKKRNLIVGCLLFTLGFVSLNFFTNGNETQSMIQGFFLAVGFVFVSFISESEKKMRAIRRLM